MNAEELQKGTLVRHVKATDWGVGVVVELFSDKARINFEHHGEAVIKVSIAAPLLEVVPRTDVDPSSPLLDSQRWDEFELPPERRMPTTAAPCRICGVVLKRAVHSADRRLKSCPRCSAEDGSEHVFYESPSAFGTTTVRESGPTPEGTQSYCAACRTGGSQDFASHRCSTVTR